MSQFTPDADWLHWHQSPSKPSYVPPAGAVDAHCHVFGPGDLFPFAPERKYTPCDASKDQLWALRDYLGFSRNVIVQATCHGADNRALVDALNHSNGLARGVATVKASVTDKELAALHAAGVRGVRFNFVKRLVDALPFDSLIALRRELEAIGTNAHELPMVYAALADDEEALRQAPYEVLADWHEEHDGNLRIILPDTYGTPGFLANAPDWLAGWTGIRVDSGDPATGAETAIRWWQERGEDPRDKLVIFSDGLDVAKIEELHAQFQGRVRVSFGWGTLLTNDFRGLVDGDALAPFSLVCKAVEADGRPTVKLSDNPKKAMGPEDEIARYKRVFGVGEQVGMEVVV